MRNLCRGCGAESFRTLARYDERMNLIGEVCIVCRPEFFEKFYDPSDNKIWRGEDAFPSQYQVINDKLYMKDEPLEDLRRQWDKGPTAKAMDHKAQTRRTTPLSQAEIRQAEQWAEASGWAPEMRRRRAEAAGLTTVQ